MANTVLVNKALPVDQRFFAFFEGVRMKSSYINDAKQDITPTEELIPLLENTVLHNLVFPEDTVLFQADLGGLEMVTLPIPPLGSIFDLEAHTVYDVSAIFVGTSIRLPNIHAGVNSVVSAINRGLTPDFQVIYRSYTESLRSAIEERLVSTRVPLGFNAPAMGGDGFLSPGEIAITKALAEEFLANFVQNFKKSIAKSGAFKGQYKNMISNLQQRIKDQGIGILNNLSGIVGKREPATSYGTLQKYTLKVVDLPGKAVYITTKDIHAAGGKLYGNL